MAQEDVFKKLVSHCKEYGFVFPSSEIYDGLGAVYDYGQMGVELKNNIKQYWWQSMVLLHENIVGIDSAIFMHPTIWKASGHVDAFNDPLIDNRDSKKRYRADELPEAHAKPFAVAAGVGKGRKAGKLLTIKQYELGKGQCKHFLLFHKHCLFRNGTIQNRPAGAGIFRPSGYMRGNNIVKIFKITRTLPVNS